MQFDMQYSNMQEMAQVYIIAHSSSHNHMIPNRNRTVSHSFLQGIVP